MSTGMKVVLILVVFAAIASVLCAASDERAKKCEEMGGTYFRREGKCVEVKTIPLK